MQETEFRKEGRRCSVVESRDFNWNPNDLEPNDDGNYRYLPEYTDEHSKNDLEPRRWDIRIVSISTS